MDFSTISLAILTPEKEAYSATFIRAHIDNLGCKVVHLFGVFFPTESIDQQYRLKVFPRIEKWAKILRAGKMYNRFVRDAQLKRYLRRKKVDLILAEFGPVGAEICHIAEELKIPLVVHFHGFDAYAYKILKKYESGYLQTFKSAKFIIAVSRHMQKKLIEIGANPEKVQLNPCGPDDRFFNLLPSFEAYNFIAVGRFVEKKAPHLTIKAFRNVLAEFPAAHLIMVGDGVLLEECKTVAAELGIEGSVQFIGALPHTGVLELFENAYCFVQHSITASNGDAEGTPVAILEAAAASLPVVATAHAGIADVVIDGVTGFLVEEGDFNGMADRMIQLCKSPDLARQLGKNGRERISREYSMEKHIRHLQQLLKRSLI